MRFNCLNATKPLGGDSLLFASKSPEIPGTQKDESLYSPWSQPVVLNLGPLDWESSTLTTRPLHLLLHFHIAHSFDKYS